MGFAKCGAVLIGGLSGASFLLSIQAVAAEATDDGRSFLSRVIVDVPLYSRHEPHNGRFNNHNWGAFVDVAIDGQWSAVAGDFINSYKRDTIFAGVAWMPLHVDLNRVEVRAGGMLGFDLNGGYKPFNRLNPLLGAASIRFTGARFENELFNRLGLAIKVIPPDPNGGSTAINFALSYRLG